jgi:threonine dehydratase
VAREAGSDLRDTQEVSFDLADLHAAVDVVRAHVPPTPQYAWPLLADQLGTQVWVKHENHTPTGAFKVRGGLTYFRRRRERGESRGVISATTGNHGQSLAYAGRANSVPVTIVVPPGNNPDKNAAMRGFGAEVIEGGHDYQSAREHAQQLAADGDLEMVPPFHPDLVLGVATYALELFSAVSDLDVVYVPVGMGSGICGLIRTRDLLALDTQIVGVVADGAPATALSFDAGEVVSTPRIDTFLEGVAARTPDPDAIAAILAGAARIVRITDEDAAAAVRTMLAGTHNLPEPTGALALAAALGERDSLPGKRVALIQTGGNMDADRLATILGGGTPAP